MKARITITLKQGVLDPQGRAIRNGLGSLGFSGVKGVRQGKIIEIELDETDEQAAQSQIADMCEKLLANTVIENYAIEMVV